MIYILVVEHDKKINHIVCTYLMDKGFKVKGCLTAREDLSAKEKGFQIGIDDYMVKPIELAELLKVKTYRSAVYRNESR